MRESFWEIGYNRSLSVSDCDATPFIPNSYSVHPDDQIKSAVHGQLEFDPLKVVLHLDNGQEDGRTIKGDTLRARLEGKLILTANILDHLLANLRT